MLGLLLAAAAFWALNGQRGELAGASVSLTHLKLPWLLGAIASEVVSFVWFGVLQRRLLACGDIKVDIRYATVLSLAAGAIADSLPAGPAFSSIYAFRQYRRRGADDALAGWTLLATLVCAALSLALIATAGVLLATSESAAYDLVGVTVGVLALAVVADAVVWQRQWLARVMIAALRLSRRLFHQPTREAVDIVDDLLARLTSVHLTWRDLGTTILAGLGNWAFDCGCLACSFMAVGAGVPWRGLLLAYGAGQLAANLPITPGGLGVVEGSLTIALVAFGGVEVSTVAAVLCYRIVSFWGYLPVGWTAWASLAFGDRRRDARALAEAVQEHPPATAPSVAEPPPPVPPAIPLTPVAPALPESAAVPGELR
ncbi:MAG: hypothetical protein JWO62_874 [Acidimicrobiaceae bacterium]|nr:hypothetical protein [Acidimicrobiaceae bacterium]